MSRILIIAPNWIGDTIMAQPLFRLLKEQAPDAILDVLAPPGPAAVLKHMPEIRHIHPTHFFHKKLELFARWKCARQLQKIGYTHAYILPNSAKSALIPWMAGIPIRIGYTGEQRYGLLTQRFPNHQRHRPRPFMVQHYAALAGIPLAPIEATSTENVLEQLQQQLPLPQLQVPANDASSRALLQRLGIDGSRPLLALCPGAEYGPAKRWPPEHFAVLAQHLTKAFPALQIIALGIAKEAPLAATLCEKAPHVHNLCGKTTLEEACILLARASAVVANDSGLMHVAAALQRPLLALYGPTDPRHTPPLTTRSRIAWLHLACSPCFARTCPLGHNRCQWELTPEQAFEHLNFLLQDTMHPSSAEKAQFIG